MKILITEEQLKYLKSLHESQNVSSIKDINWYGLISSGRDIWNAELNKNVKIPEKFKPLVTKLMLSLTNNLKTSIETDVMKGSLSPNTIKIFNGSVTKSLNDISNDKLLNTEFDNLSTSSKFLAKTAGRIIINNKIDLAVNLTGKKFFIDGMITNLKKNYDQNSPIVKNYIKVLTQMGNSVSTNQPLKDQLYNLIMDKL
jgi:hypothetical protein